MPTRKNYSSASVWEERIGYSRAVRIGNIIEVSGTVSTNDDGTIHGRNNAYEQTKFIYQKIERILKEAGAEMKDVVRVRMYVTNISQWQEYGRAHSEFFKSIKPCNTMVEVVALINEGYLVEIEATAILEQ